MCQELHVMDKFVETQYNSAVFQPQHYFPIKSICRFIYFFGE
jgi:hypothetical protein